MKIKEIITASTLFLAITFPVAATDKIPVDMELVLSVDSSSSIDNDEYDLQSTGYANAFRDSEVISTITNLPLGLAVTMELWTSESDTSMGWYHLKTESDVLAFANVLENFSRLTSSGTDIELGVRTATNSLLNNNYQGEALVIDVSGDGISYYTDGCDVEMICPTLQSTRDNAVNQGIIINGLPINMPDGDSDWFEDRIDEHYQLNVIGGEGSFIEVAEDFSDFSRAVKAKILKEIVDNTPPSIYPD